MRERRPTLGRAWADRFVFETPYTVDGTHHGTVETQRKRLTVLTSEVPFPAMTRRVPVVKREEVGACMIHTSRPPARPRC